MVENTGRPKYLQVADDLRRAIRHGTYAVGAELPSTAQLMATYGVSSTVVRAAMRELRGDGLVVGQPGKAVYVRAAPAEDAEADGLADLRKQVRSLSTAVDEALAKLDARVSDLERQARRRRTS